jgi:hypothetical protein
MVRYYALRPIRPTDPLVPGPIVRVTLAGDDIVVLSDPADAEELVSSPSIISLAS